MPLPVHRGGTGSRFWDPLHTADTWYENLEFGRDTIWLSNLTGNRVEQYDLDGKLLQTHELRAPGAIRKSRDGVLHVSFGNDGPDTRPLPSGVVRLTPKPVVWVGGDTLSSANGAEFDRRGSLVRHRPHHRQPPHAHRAGRPRQEPRRPGRGPGRQALRHRLHQRRAHQGRPVDRRPLHPYCPASRTRRRPVSYPVRRPCSSPTRRVRS